MPRLLIGVDSTNTGCIKIMKNNADNPYSTPDTDYAKFYFNSKWDMQIRFSITDSLGYINGGAQSIFYPSGSGGSNFTRAQQQWVNNGPTLLFWRETYFPNVDYSMPVYDLKVTTSGGVYSNCVLNSVEYKGGVTVYSPGYLEDGYVLGLVNNVVPTSATFNFNGLLGSCVSGEARRMVIWNLPANEAGFVNPPTTPIAGQKVVEINSVACRVAKPGYDVTTAIASQLAFDSANRPAKIIASGDIAVPTGTTVFDFSANLAGINVTGELVADVIQYKGSTITFPASLPSDDDAFGAQYYFSGTTLVFSNSGSACRARILIISQDNSSGSSGSNKVFRQLTISGQDVFQFIRPGAANPPTLADVIIDSRWPCLQIIATGVFTIPTGADAITDIAFDSSGLFPFIKYFTIHGSGFLTRSRHIPVSGPSARVRAPFVASGRDRSPSSGGAYNRWTCGETTYCELTTNRARFHTWRGQPFRYYWDQNSNNVYVRGSESVQAPAYAIRYYIFGIPA
jgi:hypothetical protein